MEETLPSPVKVQAEEFDGDGYARSMRQHTSFLLAAVSLRPHKSSIFDMETFDPAPPSNTPAESRISEDETAEVIDRVLKRLTFETQQCTIKVVDLGDGRRDSVISVGSITSVGSTPTSPRRSDKNKHGLRLDLGDRR